MCGCALISSRAVSAARSSILAKPAVENGAPRSETNTNGDASDSRCSQSGQPVNAWATALWHIALKREGYDRGLRRTDGTIIDWLVGNVAVAARRKVSTRNRRPPH